MSAGDISKSLAYKVWNRLRDNDHKLIQTAKDIYDLMNQFQEEWMSTFLTTKQTFTITLTDDTEYDMDPRLMKITDYWDNINDRIINGIHCNCYLHGYIQGIWGTPDYRRRKIEILNRRIRDDITTLYIEGFVKPATHSPDGGKTVVSDDICSTFDPIIGSGYHPYLVDAVCSKYSTKENPQTNYGTVREFVRVKSNSR